MTIKTIYRVEVEFEDKNGVYYTTEYSLRIRNIIYGSVAPTRSGSQTIDGIVTEWAEYEGKIRATRAEADLIEYFKFLQ